MASSELSAVGHSSSGDLAVPFSAESNWYAGLAPGNQALADEALRRVGLASGSELLSLSASRSRRGKPSSTSRQSRHARLQRARASCIAAIGLLCGRDSRFEQFLLDPQVRYLRPLSAETHRKVTHFTHLVDWSAPLAYAGLFARASEYVLDAYRDAGNDLACVDGLLGAMFLPCILFGSVYRPHWEATQSEADRDGLLANRYLRLQLSLMGSYVGTCERHIEWLLDRECRNLELADIYLFVRHDFHQELFDYHRRLVAGEDVSPSLHLHPHRPLSTLRHMGDYILTCMRSPHHFNCPGLMLMVLEWVHDLEERYRSLRDAEGDSRECASIETRLRRIRSVQAMERQRFALVVESTRGACRDRLEFLWNTLSKPVEL